MSKPKDNTQTDHIVDVHEMVTDTNQASELFELCKKLYEKTGWIEVKNWNTTLERWEYPYTSDYLLEKLPATLNDDENDTYGLTVHIVGDGSWLANYTFDNVGMWHLFGDTPLLALLRLTITLSEAGELK